MKTEEPKRSPPNRTLRYTTVRLPSAVRLELKATCAMRGVTMEHALLEASEIWCNSAWPMIRDGSKLTPEQKRANKLRDKIMMIGNKQDVEVLNRIIEALLSARRQ